MTKEEIIEMARQAGFVDYELDDGTTDAFDKRYEAFAKLVAEKAIKEALAQPEPYTEWLVCPKCDHKSPYSPIKAKTLAEDAERITKQARAALAQPGQEPVAWGVFDHNLHDMFFAKEEAHEMVRLKGDGSTVKPLYATPPQRKWVGLTYEEKHEIRYSHMTSAEFIEFIEAKLKEKNNV